MAGFKIEVGVKKSVQIIKDRERFEARVKVLYATAQKVQARARYLSARRPTAMSKGKVTGNLQDAIQISSLDPNPSATRMGLRVFVDTDVAVSQPDETDAGGYPYARAQEFGTGIYAEPTDEGGFISEPTPKNHKWMHWIQPGNPPYRGLFIRASAYSRGKYITKPLKRKRGGRTHHTLATVTAWNQYALRIHGVKPKHYMRDALSKQIQAEHKAAIASTAKIVEVK